MVLDAMAVFVSVGDHAARTAFTKVTTAATLTGWCGITFAGRTNGQASPWGTAACAAASRFAAPSCQGYAASCSMVIG